MLSGLLECTLISAALKLQEPSTVGFDKISPLSLVSVVVFVVSLVVLNTRVSMKLTVTLSCDMTTLASV